MFSHGKFWPKTFEPATIKKKKKKERTAPRQPEQPRAHSRKQTSHLSFTLHLQIEAFPHKQSAGCCLVTDEYFSENILDHIRICVFDRNDIHERKMIRAAHLLIFELRL